MTRTRWLLIAWMLVISAVAFLDRTNISVAGRAMENEYGLTDVQLGWVFSAFLLGYALFQAPGGRIADKYGPHRVIAFATVWWGVFTALSGAVPSNFPYAVAVLICVRFGLGLGESVVYPASNRLVAEWIPSKERGLANGLIFAGVGVGAGLSPPLIARIMSLYGWRASFMTTALIGLVAGAVWLWICRDKPSNHPWVSPEELAYIESDLPNKPKSGQKPAWGLILRSRNLAAITASYFTFGYAAYIFFSWFFIYLNKVRSLDLKSSALYGMLPFLAMATGSTVGGWISDRITSHFGKRAGRCGVAGVSLALAAVFVAMGPRVTDARLAAVVLAGGAGAIYLSQSVFWALTSELGGAAAGTTSGVMNMGNQIGGTITASLSPYIALHFGWTASFTTSAVLCLFGGLLWFFVDPEQPFASRSAASSSESSMPRAAFANPKTAS